MSTTLEDFIPEYADADNPDFIRQTALKKEFYDLRLPREEEQREEGQHELLLSQQFMSRFISDKTPYRKLLLMHGLGSGKCISPLTRIPTSAGTLNAESLWGKYASPLSFPDGDGGYWSPPEKDKPVNIACYDEKTGKMTTAPISNFYRQWVKEDMVTVTLDDGSEITITKAHHLYDGEKWTNEFEEGMRICVPEVIPDLNLGNENPNLVALLGWQISEGHERRKSAQMIITQDDEHVLRQIKKLADALFKEEKIKARAYIKLRHDSRSHDINISSVAYRKYLEERGYKWGRLSAQKDIPDFVVNAPEKDAKAFLRNYFDGDGTVEKQGIVTIVSASPNVIHKLSLMLRRFGVWLRISKKIKAATNGHNIKRLYYQGTLSKQDSILFKHRIGFGYSYKQELIVEDGNRNTNVHVVPCSSLASDVREITNVPYRKFLEHHYITGKEAPSKDKLETGCQKLEAYGETRLELRAYILEKLSELRFLKDRQLLYPKIKSIRLEPYEGWVYDFEIATYHNYVAENIICHNTCLTSAIVENFKLSTVGGAPRQPALVFVKNEVLKQSYIDQVVTTCTKDVYVFTAKEREIAKGTTFTEEFRRRRIENEVRKTYEIETFQTFLRNLPSDRVIKEKYSNRAIIIDESHNFRIQPSTKEDVPEDEKGESDEGVDSETYGKMHHFLHTVENCIVLLLTGTPIWDRTNEIATQMNLILELDNQLPTGRNFDKEYFEADGSISPANQIRLKEYFAGRISFLRSATTTAERLEMGVKAPWLNYVTIYPDGMSELQSLAVEEARKRDSSFLRISRDASIFVFPVFDAEGDVTSVAYGKTEFNKRVVKKRKVMKMIRSAKGEKARPVETTVDTFQLDPKLKNELVKNLADYSAIFASIVKQIKDNPNECVFIYDEFVRGGGGVIMLGLILEAFGLVRANKVEDIAKPRSDGRKRYAMITNNDFTINKRKPINDLLKSASKADNRYGDRLQVIIGSKKIAEGVNMKGFRQVHVVVPPWNIPSIDQPLFRVFRFGSHAAFTRDERYVKIFRHVAVDTAVPSSEGYDLGEGFPPEASFTDTETVGIHVYTIAENKEYRNTQIYRLIKEAAVDCAINYKRNVVAEDVPGTRECDFEDECNYVCDNFPPSSTEGKVWKYDIPAEELDHTTNNLFYSKQRRKALIADIIKLYGVYFALELNQISDLLSVESKDKIVLLQALDTIINGRILVKNRYGFGSYLKEEGNLYFLDSSVSSSSSYAEVTYIRQPLVTERTPLQDLIENLELTKDAVNVETYCNDPTPDNLDKLSFRTKIILLETAYKFRAENGDNLDDRQLAATALLLDEFADSLYTLQDGTVAHILYTEEYKGLGYNVAAREIRATGMTRYYDTEEGLWKYVTDPETEEKYVAEIRDQYVKTRRTFEGNPYGIYGYVAKDKKFRIVLAGSEARGKVCSSIKVPQLVSIFVNRLHYYPEPKENIANMSRADVIRGIRGRPGYAEYKKGLDDLSDDELRGLLTLLSMQQDELCGELRLWLLNNDLLDA